MSRGVSSALTTETPIKRVKMLSLLEKDNKIEQPAECLQHCDGPNRNGSYGDHVMAKEPLPSPEVLRQLLRYEPDTGKLFWKERGPEWFVSIKSHRAWNARFSGKEALTAKSKRYKNGFILWKKHLAHRVAFAIFYGRWPYGQVDHIDGNGENNRIQNLRDVDSLENNRNMRRAKNNKSGITGVHWCATYGSWVAQIQIKGRGINLGSFKSLEEAAQARKNADLLYGFHENHGR